MGVTSELRCYYHKSIWYYLDILGTYIRTILAYKKLLSKFSYNLANEPQIIIIFKFFCAINSKVYLITITQ